MNRFSRRVERQSKSIRLIWKFLTFYIIVLIIPLVLGGVIYGTQIGRIEQEILDRNRNELALNKAIIESALEDIENVVNDIRREPALSSILQMSYPIDPRRVLDIRDAYERSAISQSINPYLIDVVVYMNKPRLLLTKQDVYFNAQLFYPRFFELDEVQYEQWIGYLTDGVYYRQVFSEVSGTFYNVKKDAIALRTSLPFTNRNVSQGSVIALIDKRAIDTLLREKLIVNEGFAYIQMPNQQMFAFVATDGFEDVTPFVPTRGKSGVVYQKLGGQSMAIAYMRSDYNDWLYVSGVPKKIFLRQSQLIQTMFIVLLGLIIVIGMPVSLFLAYGSSKPFLKISDILKDGVIGVNTQKADTLEYISESVSELIDRNENLRDLLDEQKPYLRNVVIDRIFRGDFHSKGELDAFMEHFGIAVKKGPFGVFCVYIDGFFDTVNADILKEFIIKNTLIRKELADILPVDSLIHEIGLNQIGVVVVLEGDDEQLLADDLAEVGTDIFAHLNAQKDIKCLIAGGPVVPDLLSVQQSLQVAINHIAKLPADQLSGDIGLDLMPAEGVCYYPPELEMRIVSLVASGQQQELISVLENLKEENFINRELSVGMLHTLVREVEGTRFKILNRLAVPAEAWNRPEIPADASLTDTIPKLLDDFVSMADTFGDRQSQHHRFKKPILEYIAGNYMDPEMSLKKLALEFNLSEAYLSHLFREIIGENFFTYIEGLRMDQAMKLLKTAKLTVDEVAHKLGYKSSHVFRRAFKRKAGVSPSAYR